MWDPKTPGDQVRDAVAADASLLDRVESLSEDEREQWRADVFGSERSLADLLRLRLGEIALHTTSR